MQKPKKKPRRGYYRQQLFEIKLQDFSEQQAMEKQQASYISCCQYDTTPYTKSILQIFYFTDLFA
jgi:hypothetical protein